MSEQLIEGWEALKLFKEGVKVQVHGNTWSKERWEDIDSRTHIFNCDGWQFRRKPEPVRARRWWLNISSRDISALGYSTEEAALKGLLLDDREHTAVPVIELTPKIREILMREGEL